jgi:diguanylate cyclase (GGDEF)-like protein/PAS domain S-box-containing protein
VPVSLIIFFVLWHVTNDAAKNARHTIQNYVQLTSSKLSDEFNSSIREIELYAQTHAVKSMDPNLFLPFFSRELERQTERYEKLYISNKEGHFYTNFCGNPALDQKCTFDDADPKSKPKHLKARSYWQKLVGNNHFQKNMTYLSDPVISYTTGVKQLIFASTVFDYQERLQGMVGAAIEWKRIEALLVSLQANIFAQYDWQPKMMLVSESGTYWYHWQAEKLVHLKRDAAGVIIKDNEGLPISVSSSIYAEPDAALHQAHIYMLQKKSGFIEYESLKTKESNYIFYAPIASSQYSIALIVPEKDVNADSYALKNLYLLIFIIALCVFMVAAILIAKAITDPIGRLVGQANRLKEGNYSQDKLTTGSDELSELSKTFTQMATVIVDRQNRLEQSEERFDLAMKGANDGLWDWHLGNNTVYYSPRWKKMLGYEEGELGVDSRIYFDLLDQKDHKRIKNEIEKVRFSNKETFNHKIRMKHKDGHYVHILTRGIIVRNDDGVAERFVGTHVDISEQTLNEEKIKGLNEDLEKTVKERTLKLEIANRHLKELAMMDMMLNIGNRRGLEKHLDKMHNEFKAFEKTYSLLLFDVDYFKKYNDLYGHQQGDSTLIQVVNCLNSFLKKSERMYRYGGEEFICVLPDTDIEKAYEFAKRLVKAVKALNIKHSQSHYDLVTVSVGCSQVSVNDVTWEQVINRSDEALYNAKANGRNLAKYYDS